MAHRRLVFAPQLSGWIALSALGVAAGGCNEEPMFLTNAAHVDVTPSAYLLDTVNDSVQFTALAFDGGGRILPAPFLVWRSSDRAVATINANRGMAKSLSTGVTTIQATVGSVTGTARLEVYLDPYEGIGFTAGQRYHGRNDYVEYLAGDLPIVISVPHDGSLLPDDLPDRTAGTQTNDEGTAALATEVVTAIHDVTGRYPHVVVSHLDRRKIEMNESMETNVLDNTFTRRAWKDYHGFLQYAKDAVLSEHSGGLYLDLHGHDHDEARVELGYLISASDLSLSDLELDQGLYVTTSSIRGLVTSTGLSFSDLLRGMASFGDLLDQAGYSTVPSSAVPDPAGAPYGTGGYSVERYGSAAGGSVSAIAVQVPFEGVLNTGGNRTAFGDALVSALGAFLAAHFQFDWSP